MRKILMILVILAFIVPMADAQWFRVWTKDKKYDLGTDPTLGALHKLNEDLGWFIVDKFDKDYSVMTVAFKPGTNASNPGIVPNPDSRNWPACKTDGTLKLKWDEVCAFKAKDKDQENEYHMLISWWYEDKNDVRVVVVEVKMKRIKLD